MHFNMFDFADRKLWVFLFSAAAVAIIFACSGSQRLPPVLNERSLRSQTVEVVLGMQRRIADLENENKSLRNENEALKKVAVGNNRFRVQPNQVKIEMSSWIK